MQFIGQEIPDCYVVSLDPVTDDRGFFARAFSDELFEEMGLESHVAQINIAKSVVAGTIRGIHWQAEPHSEAKLVRCINGRVFDVCVDVRPESDTWGSFVGVELCAENRLALYIPPGCGHAYQTLVPETELLYSTSAPYIPEAERGARWEDPLLKIDWPIADVVLSEKDRSWPDLASR